jgi:type IV fimbrial biogenesis protein FimT
MSRAQTLRRSGFTLIEMAIALLLMGVLLTLALPSFNTWMANAQIKSGAAALLSGLQLARAEAVRRNSMVEFVLGTNTGWTVSVAASGEQLQSRSENEGSPNAEVVVLPEGATRLTFNGFGRVSPNADATASVTQIEIRNPSGGACVASSGKMRCLQVRVAGGGNVRLCDPTYAAGDPRAC